MSYLWALSTNNNSRVPCAVRPYSRHLSVPLGGGGGWGLGHYHSGELLLRIEPRDENGPIPTDDIIDGLAADLVVMHAREATVGPPRRENTHPFRFKEWLFAHVGTLSGFSSFKDRIRNSIPPFIERNIRGDTDSEHLFHLFLSFLFDAGQLGRPDLGPAPIREAMHRALRTADEFAKEAGFPPSASSAVVSDGYTLVAASRGIPVDYVLIEGVRDCELCRPSQAPGRITDPVDHEDLRAVLLFSANTPAPPPGFQRLPADSSLAVNRAHNVEFAALG
ncbi:MAG: class II glutamine amidotransferase [Deltaproteobacteria bacterium]|nr:class II glutamine amidotransferase [Deltaproteobacteria bacterium]